MSTVLASIATSLDGYVAGPEQSPEHPFGRGVEDRLHRWMFQQPELNAAEIAAANGAAAYVMGRNMFGPGRGEWDLEWAGLVGRGAALPRPGVRADPPRARAAGDGRRHHLR